MAVRVSISGIRQGWGWRPMSWTVAGFKGRRGVMTMLMGLDSKKKGVLVLGRLEGGRRGQKIQAKWTADLR